MNSKSFIALAMAALGLTSGCRSSSNVCIYGGPDPMPPQEYSSSEKPASSWIDEERFNLHGRIYYKGIDDEESENRLQNAKLDLYYNDDIICTDYVFYGTYFFVNVKPCDEYRLVVTLESGETAADIIVQKKDLNIQFDIILDKSEAEDKNDTNDR